MLEMVHSFHVFLGPELKGVTNNTQVGMNILG